MDTMEVKIGDGSAAARLWRLPPCGSSRPPDPTKPGMASRPQIQRLPGWGWCERPEFRYFRGQGIFFARSRYGDIPHVRVGFHSSHFAGWHDVHGWLAALFSSDLGEVLEAEVSRVDMCVDLPLPFETVSRAMDVPRCHSLLRYTGRKRTQYFGKPPRQTYAYEKAIPTSAVDLEPLTDLGARRSKVTKATRIEVRTFGDKMPFNRLADIAALQRASPFHHVSMKVLDYALVQSYPGGRRWEALGVLSRIEAVGFGAARREYNQATGGNFTRDLGQFIRPALEIDLRKAWAHRVARFFAPKEELCH